VKRKKALDTLSETESLLSGVQSDLLQQELITEGLQTDLAKKNTEIFVQEQNILALSGQVTELLSELRIVAKALEVYEGLDNAILDTEGLGEKINKALAARIDQLKTLNTKLDQANNKLAISQANLNEKISELKTTNENLNELNNQLDETNKKLEISENELNQTINELNIKNQNLMAINESLGLEDGGIADQLQAIKNKNQELLDLNEDLLVSQKETQETLTLLEQTNLELTLRDESYKIK
jgi:tetrahydromethanopterin S-methyltransferase subunit G